MTQPDPDRPQPVVDTARRVGNLVTATFVAVGAAWFAITAGITRDNLGLVAGAVGGALTALIGLGAYLWSLRKAFEAAAKVTPTDSPRDNAGQPLKTAEEWAASYGKHGSSGVGTLSRATVTSNLFLSPNDAVRAVADIRQADAPRLKLGRLPNQGRPRLRLSAETVPAVGLTPPASVDWYSKVPPSSWGMDGNDQVGDCTIAEVDHTTKARQVAAGNPEVHSTDPEILGAYSLITGWDPARPATDQGAEMQAVRDFWRTRGIALGGKPNKILLFAQVDHTDHDLVKWCIAHFGGLGVGINFPDSAMTQFDAGQPWDVVKGARIEGGHAISAVGYDDQHVYVVTWGRVQPMTWRFWAAYVEEAWTDVDDDWLNSASGQDPLGEVAYALGQQYEQITGKANPFPDPDPAPVPVPGPAPAPGPGAPPAGLVAAVDGLMGRIEKRKNSPHEDVDVARQWQKWEASS